MGIFMTIHFKLISGVGVSFVAVGLLARNSDRDWLEFFIAMRVFARPLNVENEENYRNPCCLLCITDIFGKIIEILPMKVTHQEPKLNGTRSVRHSLLYCLAMPTCTTEARQTKRNVDRDNRICYSTTIVRYSSSMTPLSPSLSPLVATIRVGCTIATLCCKGLFSLSHPPSLSHCAVRHNRF